MSDLHWFNIPGYPEKEQTTDNWFVTALKGITGLTPEQPLYIYLGNSKIPELAVRIHAAEEIVVLNELGLHIFLYEPISSYLTTFDRHVRSEFPSEFDQNLLRAEELESIKTYADQNSLTNITVHTCDYDIEKYYTYYKQLKLICDDLLLKGYTPPRNEYEMNCNFTRKFLSLNWRYTKSRNFIALYLCKLSSHLSWGYDVSPDAIGRELWFDITKWEMTNPEIYKTIQQNAAHLSLMSPISLDVTYNQAVPIIGKYGTDPHFPDSKANNLSIHNENNNSLEKFYRDSFVTVITESRFAQPTANYSEKTYQSIVYHKPFIMVAPPKTLQYLREEGFRTFGEFWDESYDDCLNHEDRMIKILELIDYVNGKSMIELRAMYVNMKSILKHNYRVLISKTK